jgi:DNA-directed RNA polymerase subunit F
MVIMVVPHLSAANQEWLRFVERVPKRNPNEVNEVVAEVEGERITMKSLLLAKAMLQRSAIEHGRDPESVTNAQAFEYQKEVAVQIAEAKRRGITVTNEEAKKLTDEMRRNLNQLTDVQRQEALTSIKALGYSEEEFWSEAPRIYRNSIYITKLKTEIHDSAPSEEANMKAYDQFVKSLLKSPKVHIKRPDLMK